MATVRIKLTVEALDRLLASTDASVGFAVGAAPIRKAYNQWAARYSTFTRRRFNTYSRGGGDWKPLALSTILARRTGGLKDKTKGQKEAERKLKKLTADDNLVAGRSLQRAIKLDAKRKELQKQRRGKTKGHRLKQIERELSLMGRAGGHGASITAGSNLKRLIALSDEHKSIITGRGVAILKDNGVLFNAITIGQQGNQKTDLRNGVRYGFAMGVPHGVSGTSIGSIAGYHNAGSLNGRPPRRVILALPDQQTTTGMMMDLQRGIREIARGT